jgi:hypothetical protein
VADDSNDTNNSDHMEQSTLFTTSKWDLLQVLSQGDASPIELAAKAHTSLANISQQLRLLELAGFVKSRRIPNRDKGKPRIVYSLTDEFAFIVVAASKFVEKRFIKLSPMQKATLRCWFSPDPSLAVHFERCLPQLFGYNPHAIYVDISSATYYLVTDTKEAKDGKVVSDLPGSSSKSFAIKILKPDAQKKIQPSWYVLFERAPSGIGSSVGVGVNP